MAKGSGKGKGKMMRTPRSPVEKFTGEEDEFDGAEIENLIEGDIRVRSNQERSTGNFQNYLWPNNEIVWEWGSSYSKFLRFVCSYEIKKFLIVLFSSRQ